MTLKSRILVAAVCFGAFAGTAQARTYYVSSNGSDRHAGTSPEHAWQSLRRVNHAHLQPGDTVLFKGGDTFANGLTFEPSASGTQSSPITFGSYGSGRARFANPSGNDVWIPAGRHDLVFDDLDFTGGSVLFASDGGGSGTYRITIEHSSFHDTPLGALNIANYADRDWLVTGSTFQHIGDSGIFIWGSNVTITHSSIKDTGWNNDLNYAKHGLYIKGSHAMITNDVITGFSSDGVSLRSDNARVANDTIHGGVVGVAYFDFSKVVGQSQVTDNKIYGVNESFYFAGDPNAITGGPAHENFVIRGNLFKANGKINIDLTGAEHSQVDLSQNTLRGAFQIAVNAYSPTKGGSYQEEHNTIFGNGVFVWNSDELPYAAYRKASGLGDLDRIYPAST